MTDLPDWADWLTADERARLVKIDTTKRALFDERATMRNRAKARRRRAVTCQQENDDG